MEKARTRLQERSDGIFYESKNKPLGKTKPSVLQSLDTMEATTIRQDVDKTLIISYRVNAVRML